MLVRLNIRTSSHVIVKIIIGITKTFEDAISHKYIK